VTSDCLTLSLPQGLDRQRLTGWRHQFFDLGEGEEQGYHRVGPPAGEWEPLEATTVRGRPAASSVWYRADFGHPGWSERTLLRFDGAFTAANVWLNGKLLGSHYGFPGHFGFDISSYLETQNVIAVCVQALDGAGQLPPSLAELGDDQGRWWPLGMVGRAWLEQVGSVVVEAVDVSWRLLPGTAEASLQTVIHNLDARDMQVLVGWQLIPPETESAQVRWRRSVHLGGHQSLTLETSVGVDRPQLWWPWTLGEQHFYDLMAQVEIGGRRSTVTGRQVGIREIDLEPSAGGMAWTINGRRHFPRGAVLPPLPPGDSSDPIGAWRLAGLDLAVSRGQLPSERTAASADAAGVLLVVDPPVFVPGQGDEGIHRDHLREAVSLVASHASAAVLLDRAGRGLPHSLPSAAGADQPYTLTGTDRAEVEAVRRAKYDPETALVLKALPDLDEAGGVLAATAALLDWHELIDRDGLKLRFHVINDELAVRGRAVLRWRLRAEASSWLPFQRDRGGDITVAIPSPEQEPNVYEDEVSLPRGKGEVVVEVGLEQEGELLSFLEYALELD
jgi:Glycosyl hydrolases family 2, sugar binding domain/Glycosyl hydrolases family 2